MCNISQPTETMQGLHSLPECLSTDIVTLKLVGTLVNDLYSQRFSNISRASGPILIIFLFNVKYEI